MKRTGFGIHHFDIGHFFPIFIERFNQKIAGRYKSDLYQWAGITPLDWRILAILGNAVDVMTAGQLVEATYLDHVKISRGIQSLLDKGFIERSLDADDKRKAALKLSRNGTYIYQDISQKLHMFEDEMFASLNDGEKQTLMALLKKIDDAM